MKREAAKEKLKTKEPLFLQAAKQKINGFPSYVCPVCENGTGKNGTGIARNPYSEHKRWKCFVCGINEDIIGLYKLHTGIKDDKQVFEDLYRYFDINVENDIIIEQERNMQTKTNQATKTSTQQDYTDYFNACIKNTSQTTYFQERGLSQEVVKKYKLGYDPHYTKAAGSKAWQAIIIPKEKGSYIARNIDQNAPKSERYRKSAGAGNQLYLKGALKTANEPIFIVEGELDALSIIEAGGIAVALSSTANYNQLLDEVEKEKPIQPLILALDNDDGGDIAAKKIAEKLQNLDISFYRLDYFKKVNVKDPNEALMTNRDDFREAIEKVKTAAKSMIDNKIKDKYLKECAAFYIKDFINGINASVNTSFLSTGFKNLDNVLDGGLYEGLYVLGAISSLGKTTLALQIADQIAQVGNPVLIFSLEMARSELMAKSISRHTLLNTFSEGNINLAKTTRGITTGKFYESYSLQEKEVIKNSVEKYASYAENIFIYEGIGDIGIAEIKTKVNEYIYLTKKKPVVLIDYLQIVSPIDIRATDKQNTDKTVLELKRLSRDCKIPILGISSFNRANYSVPVMMEAFKESGAIEYSSDVLFGLQLKGVGETNFDVNEAKQREPRQIELVILKNRSGATGKKIDFEYYPKFNYFQEK